MRQRVEGEMRQHSGGGARDMYGLSPEERVSQVCECRVYLTMWPHDIRDLQIKLVSLCPHARFVVVAV
jgi:hypothetical protein